MLWLVAFNHLHIDFFLDTQHELSDPVIQIRHRGDALSGAFGSEKMSTQRMRQQGGARRLLLETLQLVRFVVLFY